MSSVNRDQTGAEQSRANVAKVWSKLIGIRQEQSRANVTKVWSKLIGIRQEQSRAGRILLRYGANL
jgi:hypothetical protein